MGVSVAFVRTDKGERLIESIRDICTINKTDMDFAMQNNPLLNEQKIKNNRYQKFEDNLNKYGLHIAIKKSYSQSERLLKTMKRIIKLILPKQFLILGRRFVSKLNIQSHK